MCIKNDSQYKFDEKSDSDSDDLDVSSCKFDKLPLNKRQKDKPTLRQISQQTNSQTDDRLK